MENNLLKFDNQFTNVIGVDEAGRGPLAGPVVSAAVIIKDASNLLEVNDSKKLSEKKREYLYDEIMNSCEVAVSIIKAKEIDDINILNATIKSMRECVNKINKKDYTVLVDGNTKIKNLDQKQVTVVKGDSKSLAIAAASIIAKVTRDRLMKEASKQYPFYNFEKHKGYGTAKHIEAIKEFGICELHRKSFLKNIL